MRTIASSADMWLSPYEPIPGSATIDRRPADMTPYETNAYDLACQVVGASVVLPDPDGDVDWHDHSALMTYPKLITDEQLHRMVVTYPVYVENGRMARNELSRRVATKQRQKVYDGIGQGYLRIGAYNKQLCCFRRVVSFVGSESCTSQKGTS